MSQFSPAVTKVLDAIATRSDPTRTFLVKNVSSFRGQDLKSAVAVGLVEQYKKTEHGWLWRLTEKGSLLSTKTR